MFQNNSAVKWIYSFVGYCFCFLTWLNTEVIASGNKLIGFFLVVIFGVAFTHAKTLITNNNFMRWDAKEAHVDLLGTHDGNSAFKRLWISALHASRRLKNQLATPLILSVSITCCRILLLLKRIIYEVVWMRIIMKLSVNLFLFVNKILKEF